MTRILGAMVIVGVMIGHSGPCWAGGGDPASRLRLLSVAPCAFDPHGMSVEEFRERSRSGGQACAVLAIYDSGDALRVAGLSALADAWPDVAPVLAEVRDSMAKADHRRWTSDEIIEAIVARVAPRLRSPQAEARRGTAYLLGLLCHVAALPALSSSVADSDAGVRESAVKGLEAIDDRQALDPLIRAMRDRDVTISLTAVTGVASLGGPQALDALMGVVQDKKLERNVRMAAAYELRGLRDPHGVTVADRFLESLRPQWKRVFYFGPVLWVLLLLAGRAKEGERRKRWTIALYVAAGASMVVLVGPEWFLEGVETGILVRVVLLYPLGVGLVGMFLALGVGLASREMSDAMLSRAVKTALVMWGTMLAWAIVMFVMFVLGMARAWR